MTTDDLELIVGCKAIAAACKLTTRQVTNSREKGGLSFIWREPGLGLVTTRAAAARYLQGRAAGIIANDSGPPVPLPKAG